MLERYRILRHLLRNWRPILDGKAVVIIDNGGNVNGMFGKSIPATRLAAILSGFNTKLQKGMRTA